MDVNSRARFVFGVDEVSIDGKTVYNHLWDNSGVPDEAVIVILEQFLESLKKSYASKFNPRFT